MNTCTACGEKFNSEKAFDAHRKGKFTQGFAQGERRCLSRGEMKERGMVQNKETWFTAPSTQAPRPTTEEEAA